MHEKDMSQVPSVCQTGSAPVKLGGRERDKHSIVGGRASDPAAMAGGPYRVKAQAAEARKPLQILLMLPRKCKPPCSREKGSHLSPPPAGQGPFSPYAPGFQGKRDRRALRAQGVPGCAHGEARLSSLGGRKEASFLQAQE